MENEKNVIELIGEDGKKFHLNLLFSIVRPETHVNYFFFEHPEDKDAIAVFQLNKEEMLEEVNLEDEDVAKYLNFILEAYDRGELEQVEGDDEDDDECEHHHEHHCGECCEGDDCDCECGCDDDCECEDGCCCCEK